jgi:hypothetical protein
MVRVTENNIDEAIPVIFAHLREVYGYIEEVKKLEEYSANCLRNYFKTFNLNSSEDKISHLEVSINDYDPFKSIYQNFNLVAKPIFYPHQVRHVMSVPPNKYVIYTINDGETEL